MTTAPLPSQRDAGLTRRLAEANQRAEMLRAVIDSIADDLALEPLLNRIVESAVALLGAEHGAIGLVVETAQGPVMRLVAGHVLALLDANREMAPGVGLAGMVLLEQAPVRIHRYGDLSQTARNDIEDHRLLGVPIRWSGRLIGMIGVGGPPPQEFDEKAEATLTLFAQHAAVAIEVARRFESEHRRAERVAVINSIGRLLTSQLSLDELVHTAVQALAAHLNQDTIAVMLVPPDDPEVLALRARGGVYTDSNLGDYRQSIDDGIAGAAARECRTLLINDVRRDPRYIPVPGGDGLVAELAIPLLAGDQLLGILNIESEQPFTEEEAADFEIVAAQLAIAIENARLFADTRAALDEARLLYETSRRMSIALDTNEAILAYLEQAALRGRFTCSVLLMEYDEPTASTTLVMHGRWAPESGLVVPSERLPRSRDAFDAELDVGRTITVTDFRTDPRVSDEFRNRHLQRGTLPALAMIPLMVGGIRTGLVVLSYPEPHEWSEAELRPYQVTAAQLAAAVDSGEQRRLVAERRRQVAVMDERQRLARELHDSVTQTVFSASLHAESLALTWQRDPREGARRAERLQALCHSALAELRALVAELHPSVSPERAHPATTEDSVAAIMRVRREGIISALDRYAADLAADGLPVALRGDGYVPQPIDREQVLFRIAQEALHNVSKYAQPKQVTVTLATDEQSVYLTIQDDGSGFIVPPVAEARARGTRAGGHGLAIMHERAEGLDGVLSLTSAPGSGTTVDVRVPRRDQRT